MTFSCESPQFSLRENSTFQNNYFSGGLPGDYPSNIATGLAELSHGYGFYAQQYGYFAFGASERVADNSSLQEASQAVFEQAKSGFEVLISTMTANQIKLLKALAVDPTKTITAGEYCQKHEMISSNVAYVRTALVEQDHIGKDREGWWRVVDPVFRLWLQN